MHHGAVVRSTENLEEDQYRLAKRIALAEDCSITQAINKMLARGAEKSAAKPRRMRNGFPIVRGCLRFTSEDGYEIEQS